MVKKFISSFVLSALVFGLGFGLMSVKTVNAETNENSNTNSNSNSNTNSSLSPAYIACLKTAIGERDDAIKAAWDTFAAQISTAFATRKAALLAAYDQTTNKARKEAVKAAWKAFKKSRHDARKTFNRVRYMTWQEFSQDRRACKAPEDGMGASVDSEPKHSD